MVDKTYFSQKAKDWALYPHLKSEEKTLVKCAGYKFLLHYW
jgi:hypothetical protein